MVPVSFGTARALTIGVFVVVATLSATLPAWAADEDAPGESLQEKSQNPIASLISVPIQTNLNFGVGDLGRTQVLTNFQPVYPARLGDDWNLIIRPIVPIIYKPKLFDGDTDEFGIGDLNPQFFLTPSKSFNTPLGSLTLGAGPSFQLDTATDDSLGTGKWSAGPGAVVFFANKPWTYGALIQNYWSFAGDSDREDVNQFVLQPFLNYNLEKGWYLSTAPIITANWKSEGNNNTWLVPVGGGFGRVFNIGKQPINFSLRSYYNYLSPDGAPNYQLQAQLTFLFPK